MCLIKVLYLRSSFNPGGTEYILLNLFNYPQNKIQFHYTLLKNGILIPELNSDQNIYYKISRKRKIDLVVLKNLRIILRNNDIRIVHTHQLIELVYAVFLKITKPDLNLFHTIHGYHDKRSKWAEYIERHLIRLTKKTFTVSNASRNILKKKNYPDNKMEVMYNAVAPPVTADITMIDNLKKKIAWKNDDFIAGMIGNFVWQKDQITIIKAFNILKDEIPNLKIVFIGKESSFSDKCKEELDAADLNNRVFFLGSVKNASAYLKIFDLLIMSTIMDTFGIVVIEALLQKVPVLASDIEVMRELSFEGKYFELFETQSPQSLSDKLISLYKKKHQGETEIAYKYAKEHFSYKRYIDQLIKYY